MEWIKCSERLPKPNEIVLAYTQFSWRKPMYFWCKLLVYTDCIEKGEYLFMNEGFYDSYDITHWMPLPEPPNQTAAGDPNKY